MSTPLEVRPTITSTDITRGYVTRYFAQSISTRKIYEIDKQQYDIFSLDPYYITTKLPWVIINDKVSPAGYKNTKVVEYYNKILPGLSRKLRNTGEYFSGSDNANELNKTGTSNLEKYTSTPIVFLQKTQQGTFGTEIVSTSGTSGTGGTSGTNGSTVVCYTGSRIAADYWWVACSGSTTTLTSSYWTASNGGINLNISATAADPIMGLVLNGNIDRGLAWSRFTEDVDIKHIFIRFNSYDMSNPGAVLGGSQQSAHEIAYRNSLSYEQRLYHVEAGLAGNPGNDLDITYAWYTEISQPETAMWIDFVNTPGSMSYYNALETSPRTSVQYGGSYQPRFRYKSGSFMYVGKRLGGAGSPNAKLNIKELAFFTRSLSYEEGLEFRNQMMQQWPVNTTLVYDNVSPGVILTRDFTSQGLFNTASESSFSTASSVGVKWNSPYTAYTVVTDPIDAGLTLTNTGGPVNGILNSGSENSFDYYYSPRGTLWNVQTTASWLPAPLLQRKYDNVGPGVTLTRGHGGSLFNSDAEYIWDWNDYAAPTGTEWNSEYTDPTKNGWGNLSDVTSRTYATFYEALDYSVGGNAVATELVMHDTINDNYYKFDITQWGNYNVGSTYSYTRQQIDPNTGDLIGSPVTITRTSADVDNNGWSNLTTVTTRGYDSFKPLLVSYPEEIVGAQIVMWDTINDKYYKFDFTKWEPRSPNVDYAYTRQEINPSTGTLIGSPVSFTTTSPLSGWEDLSNVTSRPYSTFYAAVGNNPDANTLSTELVMKDETTDKYYKVDVTYWGPTIGASPYSYTRWEITPETGATGSAVVSERLYTP